MQAGVQNPKDRSSRNKGDFSNAVALVNDKALETFLLYFKQCTSDHLFMKMRKTACCICKYKDADHLCSTAPLLVQSLYYLNPKF